MPSPDGYHNEDVPHEIKCAPASSDVTRPKSQLQPPQNPYCAGNGTRGHRKRRHEQISTEEGASPESNIANLDLPSVHEIYYEAICTRAKNKNDESSSAGKETVSEIRIFKKIPGAASIDDARAGGYLNYQLSDKKVREKANRDRLLWPDDVERSLQRRMSVKCNRFR